TSLLRKTTMELRIGTTGHLRYGIVQKLTFARFLASFDFRLFQHYRSNSEVGGRNREVRFNPESRLKSSIAACRFRAKTGGRWRHSGSSTSGNGASSREMKFKVRGKPC